VSLSLPHHSVTATWHNDSLTRGNFFIFLKKFKKIQKQLIKKFKKIEKLTRGTPSNGVNLDLTERANMRHFNKKGDQFETFKNLGTILRF